MGGHADPSAQGVTGPQLRNETDPESAYLAICVAAANEHRDIADWVRYHNSQGVGRVYIMDTGRPMLPELEEAGFLESGLVRHVWLNDLEGLREELIRTVNHTYSLKMRMLMAYALCVRDFAPKHEWMAFVDADEYITPMVPGQSLPDVLREYEEAGALVVNWRLYGAGGHVERPRAPVQDAYFGCYPQIEVENKHIKTIVHSRYVVEPAGSHHHKYVEGKFAVNSAWERVDGPIANSTVYDTIVLRHYVTKSVEDYTRKVARGGGMGRFKTWPYFHHVQARANQDCRSPEAWPTPKWGGLWRR